MKKVLLLSSLLIASLLPAAPPTGQNIPIYRVPGPTAPADGDFAVFSGPSTIRKATGIEIFDYGVFDGTPFLPYVNIDGDWDKIIYSNDATFAEASPFTFMSGDAILGYLSAFYVPTSRTINGNTLDNDFNITFASLASKPTTIGGYGITDFNSLGDARWSLLAHTHTFASLTSKPTTIGGYGITDFDSLGDARWVSLSGSYSNPSWITALAWSKITGTPTTLAGYGITDATGSIDFTTLGVITVSKGAAATDTRSGLSKYDYTRPFATVSAARTASASGDTIVVQPGSYTDKDIARTGRSYILMEGVTITNTDDTVGIIDDSAAGANGAITCSISGRGILTQNSNNMATVNITNASSNVSVLAKSITEATAGGAGSHSTAVWLGDGTLRVTADSIIGTGSNSHGVWWNDGLLFVETDLISAVSVGLYGTPVSTVSDCFVRAGHITATSSGTFAIQLAGAGIGSRMWVEALLIDNLNTSSGSAISLNGADKLYVKAQKIEAKAAADVVAIGSGAALLWLMADKVTSNGGNNFNNNGISSLAYLKVSQWECLANNTQALRLRRGTNYIIGGSLDRAATTGDGILSNGGTNYISGVAKISTNGANYDINSSSGTIAVTGTNYTTSTGTITIGDPLYPASVTGIRKGAGIGSLDTAASASDVNTVINSTVAPVFANITSKPTTIGGYGITDFNSLGDARWQPLDSGLTALAAFNTNGLLVQTANNTFAGRSVAGTSPISVTNGDGVSGDPTIAIANAVADGSTKGAASFTAADFNASSGNVSLDYTNGQVSSASVNGFLSSGDWTNFNNARVGAVGITIDGAGAVITTGVKGYLSVPYGCTINSVTMLADQSGSAVVDIWKTTYSSFDAGATHPVSGDKITASAPPTISSATKSTDATLTGWTTSITAGDVLAFSVTSATTVTRVNLVLKVTK